MGSGTEGHSQGCSRPEGAPSCLPAAAASRYVGQIGSVRPGGVYPGWRPYRDPRIKW